MENSTFQRACSVYALSAGLTALFTIFPTCLPAQSPQELEAVPHPTRIVSLLPSLTEILFAVGAGQQMVGVTKFCTYPPAAQKLTTVGGYVPRSTNLELVVGLQPDLVLAAGDLQQPLITELRRLGLRVETVVARDIAGVLQAIQRTGDLVGRSTQAQQVVAGLERRLEEVQKRVHGISPQRRPKVFYQVWNDPLMTAGGQTFISELITLAGGVNLFEDVDQEYFQVSLEEVVARDPEVILGAATHSGVDDPESFRRRPGWGGLQAVRNRRVFPIDGDIVSRPGPRLALALELILERLHPTLAVPATPR